MRYLASLATLGIVMTLLASASEGGVVQDIGTGYHRNKCWPQPFVYPDNMSVRAPFARMVHNGWRQQNLVAAHHFNEAVQLNEAGQRHIRWVITQAPARRHTVYVEQGITLDETEARLAAARGYAQRYAVDGEVFDVRPTHITARGWPAEYIDAINVKFGESTPEPRLPSQTSGFNTE